MDAVHDLDRMIERFVRDSVVNARTKTAYRTPVIGFADARDELFAALREACGPQHLLPSDLLPGARSVVAFFVPFTSALVKTNARAPQVAREWVVAYVETNQLVSDICVGLSAELGKLGIRTGWVLPTYEFDADRLVAAWSHKHVAYAAGLGTFGVHQMLITPVGCAGRFGSVVIDAPLQPSGRTLQTLCRHQRGEACLVCVRRCPAEALSTSGFARQRCYAHLLEVSANYSDLGSAEVCGKCATGPCSVTKREARSVSTDEGGLG